MKFSDHSPSDKYVFVNDQREIKVDDDCSILVRGAQVEDQGPYTGSVHALVHRSLNSPDSGIKTEKKNEYYYF